MEFDRSAPGEGAEAICSLEKGKMVLEWRFYFTEETGEPGSAKRKIVGENDSCYSSKKSWTVRILLTDMQGNVVAEGIQSLCEEEPLRFILLQPRLWKGIKDPYLYRLEAVLTDQDGRCLDRISRFLPLRTFSGTDSVGMFTLNGEAFERRAVSYIPPFAVSEAERQRLVTEDFRQIVRMGANCIDAERGEELVKLFLHLCDRLGLLLFCRENRESEYVCFAGENVRSRLPRGESVPCFRGEKDCLFSDNSKMPTSLFYRYLAKWSGEPFVYIIPESVEKLEDGNYSVRCYSNCGRIALYSDGTLFEFQRGEGEFTFLEVPAKTPSIILTAEGDGCSASLSLSRILC